MQHPQAMATNKLQTNGALVAKYMNLTQPNQIVQATYVWIDGKHGLRAKTKTVHFTPKSASDLPVWNFDGSSTYQSDGSNADVYLLPAKLYKDPFRKGENKLVLCETIAYDKQPTKSNTRHSCNFVMNLAADQKPWFGLEQEYHLFDGYQRDKLYGWPVNGVPPRARYEPYLYGVGPTRVKARDVERTHYRACLYSGVKLAGVNAEAMPSQLEYQIGPCEGITAADDLWMSRYILHRIAEEHHLEVNYTPKPIPGWMGNGCHTNFSTALMRAEDGITEIMAAIERLRVNHTKHVAVNDLAGGKDNARRLIGDGVVTESMDTFSFGLGKRSGSIRVPQAVVTDGRGYLEDRRPAGNMDPYVVCEMLVRTVCLRE